MIEIMNEEGLQWGLKMITKLLEAKEGSEDAELLVVISDAVKQYENEHYPICEVSLMSKIVACKDCNAPAGEPCKPGCNQSSYIKPGEQMTERMAHFSVQPKEAPRGKIPDTGWSDLAIHSGNEWDAKDRPKRWFGKEAALLVHTTGQMLPDKAMEEGVYPTVRAQKHYGRTHGCHMVCGYRGHIGGDLIQMAHEGERANGVGTMPQKKKPQQKSQHRSVLGHYSGSWRGDLPKSLVKRLEVKWPGLINPLDILPDSPNSCAIHMECTPLTKYWIKQGFKPAFPGSYFTLAQYHTIAAYAVELAGRKQWEWQWWRMCNLLGHSDVTPISRHIKIGGWDPGDLMKKKRFDWAIVIEEVTRLLGWKAEPDDHLKLPKTRKGGKYAKYK